MRVHIRHQKWPQCAPGKVRLGPWILLLPALLLWVFPLNAQDTPVPPELQAAIFQKIFSYDRVLSPSTPPRVLIAFSSDSVKLKDRLLKAFEDAGITASAQPEAELKSMSGVNVLYVATEGKSFKQLCQENSVLSITGFPSLVEKGEVAVGLAVSEDNKPKIVVHRKQLKAEGHELGANLLRLARLID